MKRYFINILISIDQFFNALLGGCPDETISSRIGKKDGKISVWMCRILNMFEKDHCKKSIEPDEGCLDERKNRKTD